MKRVSQMVKTLIIHPDIHIKTVVNYPRRYTTELVFVQNVIIIVNEQTELQTKKFKRQYKFWIPFLLEHLLAIRVTSIISFPMAA